MSIDSTHQGSALVWPRGPLSHLYYEQLKEEESWHFGFDATGSATVNSGGSFGYLEPGESEILLDLITSTKYDPVARIVAARAAGHIAYIDQEEKKKVALKLLRFIKSAMQEHEWQNKETARIVFEAIITLGKLGILRTDEVDFIEKLARFAYHPDDNLVWIQFAGWRALTLLFPYTEGADRQTLLDTFWTDGLSHPNDVCRSLVDTFLAKLERGDIR